MGLFNSILRTGFDLVTAPVEIVKDVVTMGGVCTDQKEPYTVQKLKQLGGDLEDIREDLE